MVGQPPGRYRWAILGAGTFAQASFNVLVFGLAVLAPAIRARFGLSLTEVGILLAAPGIGSIATLYLWGLATDRFGERAVISIGLSLAAGFTVGAAFATSFAMLIALIVLASACGASVNSASGRAVMHWFDRNQRGLALGVRQSAAPIAGAAAALVLPPLVSGNDARLGLLVIAVGTASGAIAGFAVIREGPIVELAAAASSSVHGALRNRNIWRLSVSGAFLVAPQLCPVGFLVVFLHGERHVSTAAAGVVLAGINAIGIVTRIAGGRWSDLTGSRIRPLQWLGLSSAALVIVCGLLLDEPLVVLVPALIVMGGAALSWNGLIFAAVAEAAGPGRSGAAIGLQQSMNGVASVVLPIAFGAFVAGTSWRVAFVVIGLFPLAAWRLLAHAEG